MKFTKKNVGPTGTRTRLYSKLEELRLLTLRAWNDNYTPKDKEEAEAIETIREYPDLAWGVLQETDTAATAYSRAASLRKSQLPSGTWEFKGVKEVDADGNEIGQVLGRYVSDEEPGEALEAEEE